ncbi:MAG: hypothetical protein ACT4O1_15480 [Gemmatimonadota bacterium]
MQTVIQLVDRGDNARDDGVLGEAFVRGGVLGTGHTPKPVDQYLREQRAKTLDRQSFRTSARGLRELFRLLGLIDETAGLVVVTSAGRQAAAFAGTSLDAAQIEFWRRVVRNLNHYGGDATASHPYQVLLRLIAKRPGITRAKCALALEAKDDSPEELERIVQLSRLPEEQIRERIGVSKSNWDNAKKVLPRFAEQLGDVVKNGQNFTLADAPGSGEIEAGGEPAARAAARHRQQRRARAVTPETIGAAGIAERDEPPVPPSPDPVATAAANRLRADRLRRHNLIVRSLAARFAAAGLALYEDPYDVLAVHVNAGVLGEVKTLDGSVEDERGRVRDALAQLLYYEAFLTTPAAQGVEIQKVACFEGAITDDHQRWLNQSGITVIWAIGDGRFAGDDLAKNVLGPYLEELR